MDKSSTGEHWGALGNKDAFRVYNHVADLLQRFGSVHLKGGVSVASTQIFTSPMQMNGTGADISATNLRCV